MSSGDGRDALAPEVRDLLASYQAAFEQLDAAAIGGHFAFPLHVTGDGREVALTVVPDGAAWAAQLARLVAMYRAVGFARARVRRATAAGVSPGIVQLVVGWALEDGAGLALYDFTAAYTLARLDGRLRIVAIAHDELPAYRACVARRAAGS